MSRQPALSNAISKVRRRDWAVAVLAILIAIAATATGNHWEHLVAKQYQRRAIEWGSAGVLLVLGVVATRRIAELLGRVVRNRSALSAGAAVRLVVSGIGYLVVFFALLASLKIGIEHLLVGAGVAGVVLGIAAQQSLGNVFAGFVLLLARPFDVGEHIRIRSGALGGIFDGTVLAISLTYVTLRIEDGMLRIPNSALLAAAVGPFPEQPPSEHDAELGVAPGPAQPDAPTRRGGP